MNHQQLRDSEPGNSPRARQLRRFCAARWLALLAFLSLYSVSAAAQSYAYVPTHKSNPVSVINITTRSVIAEIPVASGLFRWPFRQTVRLPM